jgi:RNA polymerase sigma-70 factor (ECF subfamily)
MVSSAMLLRRAAPTPKARRRAFGRAERTWSTLSDVTPPEDRSTPGPAPLTELLRRATNGEQAAAESALPAVYHELRRIAQARMANERAGHTLQATALVHETWLKLVGMGAADWSDRAAFYHAAATAMRRILVDHARRRARLKRGGGRSADPATVSSLPAKGIGPEDAIAFLHVDQEIARLEAEDPRAGAVVRLRFFGGLDVDETAATLGLSRRTVLREWAWARARLFAALAEPGSAPDTPGSGAESGQ